MLGKAVFGLPQSSHCMARNSYQVVQRRMQRNAMAIGTRYTFHVLIYFLVILLTYAFKLKAEFLVVQHLQGQLGWSWDEAQHRITAPDDIWNAHIAVCIPKFVHASI
jgi:hypothetical protein